MSVAPKRVTDWHLKGNQLIAHPGISSDGRFGFLNTDPREPHGESTENG